MPHEERKAFAGLLGLTLTLAALMFLPAWTLHYWQAWMFLAVFIGSSLLVTIYLIENDPELLARRVQGVPSEEKEPAQKVILLFLRIAFIGTIVVPALDHRFGWSKVSPYAVVAGDVVIVLGFAIVLRVFKENTFTSAIIEVSPSQKVISTGPYALIRHPMYSGALLLLFAIPPALGSWWGLLTLIPLTATIVLRLLDEEKFLAANLPGYTQYLSAVKYRLLPFIW